MAKAADLSKFQVNVEKPAAPAAASGKKPKQPAEVKLISKGFRVTPEAARQFDLLKAELETDANGKNKGPILIAEALNMLFKKYGKPPIA
jgi:hypothetical protein